MRELPGSCVHAWQGGSLVGQIELKGRREDASEGYVNLDYLVPEARGTGVAPELDRYAITWFSALGLSRAALGVSPRNVRAVAFYLKQGWRDVGLHPRHPDVRLMRKAWAVSPERSG
jgi:GNAT superfamily N-acetyltransferase